jgi:predicted unusual protein kinase regulating ubiquinone biosynthesis (AarF/ABC1/UbiB family)
MYKIFNEILTISKIFWIFLSESTFYFIFKDYSNFIKRLTKNLAEVNILYVKLFQAIASNNNLIDDNINVELLKFTDNAPWNYSDIQINKLIQLEDKYNLHIENGYETPINSGMISLVFKAYKRSDGSPVIIKMKRKNIEIKLDNAIENLKTFLYLLSIIPIIKKYQIKNLIEKNIEIIKHQTNFKEEVENILKVKKNCENLKYVKIPQVYPEVTDEFNDFIIMEYIDGIKVNQVKKEDYIGFSKQVIKFGLVTTIVHGVCHADLHSGNILFIKDDNDTKYPYKIGVIDFGIIFELQNEYKETLFNWFTNFLKIPPRESITYFLNSNIIEPPNIMKKIPLEYYESILEYGSKLLGDAINDSNKINQILVFEILSKLNEYLNTDELKNLGIRPCDSFVKSQLVLAMAHGVTMTLSKDNYKSLFNEVLNELFHTDLLDE